MTNELVHLRVDDQVATITLDSEHNRNALSKQLMSELAGCLQTADTDTEVKAIVLRSAGRVFCSGADLTEASEGGMGEGTTSIIGLQRQIAAADTPVIVVLAGPVRAGGLGLVGAADIVLAADSVSLALTESRLALAPAVISLSLLERFGDRAAAELFLTGRTFDATEAAAAGLVTRAVPDAELDRALADVLDELSQAHVQGLRETKRLLNRDLLARIDADGDAVAEQSARLFASDAAREAMQAFLTKRKA